MIGGYYTYSDSRFPFKYFSAISEMFTAVGKDRFNIEIKSQFSTADDFLDAIKEQKNTNYPVMENSKDFIPSLKVTKCETCPEEDTTMITSQVGYISNYAELKQAVDDLTHTFRVLEETVAFVGSIIQNGSAIETRLVELQAHLSILKQKINTYYDSETFTLHEMINRVHLAHKKITYVTEFILGALKFAQHSNSRLINNLVLRIIGDEEVGHGNKSDI